MHTPIRDARRAKVGTKITLNGREYVAVECKAPAPVGCCDGCPFLMDLCDELVIYTDCIKNGIVFKPADAAKEAHDAR